jgi:ATP-dependent DNA helicase RecG
MILSDEIKNMILNGENSTVEFKQEGVHNDSIAKEIVSFLNFKGGTILFGVNDCGEIEGIKDDSGFEERIMNIFYNKIFPSVVPEYEKIAVDGKFIAVVKVEQGTDKPYYTKINGKSCYFLRYGSTSREATREELLRMFQASGNVHYEVTGLLTAVLRDMDMGNIEEYFLKYRNVNLENFSEEEIERILVNSDVLVDINNKKVPTVAGMLMFGKNPKRFLAGAGIRAMNVKGQDISDNIEDFKFFERDVFHNIENTLDYLKIRIREGFTIENSAKRVDISEYPFKVLRELIVNAVAHRDYTITGSNIAVVLFPDRIEIKSPGSIPNTLTVEKMKQGIMYHRNPVLVQYLYDAGYVERLGRGVRSCVEIMRKYNGTEIDIATDQAETKVIVYKSDG